MRPASLVTLTLLAWALSLVASASVPVLNTEGFESPAFATGGLGGQNSWVELGTGASSAVVQTGIVESGSQALRVDRKSGSDRFWAKRINASPVGRVISIDWDMRVSETVIDENDPTAGFGPFFGVNAFSDTGTGTAVEVLAGLGVDAATGDVLFQEGGTGLLLETPIAVNYDVWAHYRIELDFENNRYRAIVEGSEVASTPFVDTGFGILSDADIVTFRGGDDAASVLLEGTAYFDNFVIRNGLAGDYNDNGVVDAADYTLWRDQLGQTGFSNSADGDANGIVDQADYLIWRNNFGLSNAAPGSASSVPEPCSVTLWGFLVGSWFASRWRALESVS